MFLLFSYLVTIVSIISSPEKYQPETNRTLYNFWILISGAFITGAAEHYGALSVIYMCRYLYI